DGSIGFPNTIGVTGWMTGVSDEENFRPKILVECVLGFYGGEIIAGRDNAAVQNDQIVFGRGKDDRLFRAGTQGWGGEEDGGVIKKFTQGTIIHESGRRPTYWIYEFYNTNPPS